MFLTFSEDDDGRRLAAERHVCEGFWVVEAENTIAQLLQVVRGWCSIVCGDLGIFFNSQAAGAPPRQRAAGVESLPAESRGEKSSVTEVTTELSRSVNVNVHCSQYSSDNIIVFLTT